MRVVLLGVTLVVAGAFAAASAIALARGSHTGLAVVSLIVAAMFAFGIVGALRHPPEE